MFFCVSIKRPEGRHEGKSRFLLFSLFNYEKRHYILGTVALLSLRISWPLTIALKCHVTPGYNNLAIREVFVCILSVCMRGRHEVRGDYDLIACLNRVETGVLPCSARAESNASFCPGLRSGHHNIIVVRQLRLRLHKRVKLEIS